MCEHIGRYERFMSQMADEGWICFGYDHLGHGKTAADPSEFGYIADKKGYELLIDDVKRFADAVISKYTAEKGVSVPVIAMAFIFTNPDLNVFAVSGSTKPEHMQLNIDALDMTLTAAERSWLDLETDER
jgi:alpha-beta hydrolase superfamily lysophospholipase